MNTFIEKYTKTSKVISHRLSIGFGIISVILYILNILNKFQFQVLKFIDHRGKFAMFLEIFFIRYMNLITSEILLILILPNIFNPRKVCKMIIEITLYLHIIFSIVFIFYNSFYEKESIVFEPKFLFDLINLSKFPVIIFLTYGVHLSIPFHKDIIYILIPLSIYLLQYCVISSIFIELKYKDSKYELGYSSHLFSSIEQIAKPDPSGKTVSIFNQIIKLSFLLFIILIYDFIFTSYRKNFNLWFNINEILNFMSPASITQDILIFIHIGIFIGICLKIQAAETLENNQVCIQIPIIFLKRNLAVSRVRMMPVLLLAILLGEILNILAGSMNNSMKFYICSLQLFCYLYFIFGEYDLICVNIFNYFMFAILSVILIISIYGTFIDRNFLFFERIFSSKIIAYMIFFLGILTAVHFKGSNISATYNRVVSKYREKIGKSNFSEDQSINITSNISRTNHIVITSKNYIILIMFFMVIFLAIIRIHNLVKFGNNLLIAH